MKTVQFATNLPILIAVEVRKETIEAVDLSYCSQGLTCSIQGVPSTSLEDSILNFVEAYSRKQQAPLPSLNWSQASPFTQQVLRYLATVPFGTFSNYSQAAQMLGIPKACRAVGTACGRNPFPFFLPCHRILGKNGLGGFSCGLDLKKILLSFEE